MEPVNIVCLVAIAILFVVLMLLVFGIIPICLDDNQKESLKGDNGVPGDNGTPGTNGTDGTTGTNGTDGTNGTNGTDGTNGKEFVGSQGKDGVGSPGLQGPQGPDGVQGMSGSSFIPCKYNGTSILLRVIDGYNGAYEMVSTVSTGSESIWFNGQQIRLNNSNNERVAYVTTVLSSGVTVDFIRNSVLDKHLWNKADKVYLTSP